MPNGATAPRELAPLASWFVGGTDYFLSSLLTTAYLSPFLSETDVNRTDFVVVIMIAFYFR